MRPTCGQRIAIREIRGNAGTGGGGARRRGPTRPSSLIPGLPRGARFSARPRSRTSCECGKSARLRAEESRLRGDAAPFPVHCYPAGPTGDVPSTPWTFLSSVQKIKRNQRPAPRRRSRNSQATWTPASARGENFRRALDRVLRSKSGDAPEGWRRSKLWRRARRGRARPLQLGQGDPRRFMVQGLNIRCPHCRAPVSVEVIWATGEACPACSRSLGIASPPPPDRPPVDPGAQV